MRRGVIGGWLLVLTTGCNGAHLYNSADDDLAKKAQSSFADAKLSDSLMTERTLMDTMRDRELAVVKRHTLARRDLSIAWLLMPSTKRSQFKTEVEGRLIDISGSVAKAREVASAASQLGDAENTLALRKKDYQLLWRMVKSDGSEADFSTAPTEATLKASYKNYQVALADYTSATSKIALASDGELGGLAMMVANTESLQRDLETSSAAADNAYQEAKKKYDARIAAGSPFDIKAAAVDLKEKLAATTQPVEQASAGLEKVNLGGLGLGGLIKGIQAQQQNIGEVLDVVVDGTGAIPSTASDKTKLRLGVVASFTSLGEQLDNGLNYPKVGVLLLESNRLQIELDATKRRLATAQQELTFLQQERDALAAEVVLLVECDAELQAAAGDGPMMPTAAGADSSVSDSAILKYADAWTVWRVEEEQAKYQIIALRQTASLDESQVALAQWQNLIGEPISQLVSLYGSGIKAQDVANLIQAAGLGAIGYGTNK